MSSSRINAYFNQVSETYSEESHGFIWRILRNPEKQAFSRSFQGAKLDSSFLEIGAGAGFYTKHFLDSGFEVTCLDSSEMMIKKLSELKIKVIHGNFEKIDIKGQYDVILMLGVVEFLEFPWSALSKTHQLLKDDGHIYAFFPLNNFFGFFYKCFHLFHGFQIKLFSRKQIDIKLNELNFKVEEIQPAGLFNLIVRMSKKDIGIHR